MKSIKELYEDYCGDDYNWYTIVTNWLEKHGDDKILFSNLVNLIDNYNQKRDACFDRSGKY